MRARLIRARLLPDERLARGVRDGDDAAFDVLFRRHQPAVLSFCRHMLGRADDAQDAAQHTFMAAYRMLRAGDVPDSLRTWLLTVARNRCVSMLRTRREVGGHEDRAAPATDGLAAQVQERAELRALLSDLAELPDDQRAALLLAEIGDLSHQQIARVIDVRREKVKALVLQARRSLLAAREARDLPCVAVQEELATARGAALRRAHLRRHLHICAGCREFRDRARDQRRSLALLLPVSPAWAEASAGAATAGAGAGAAAAAVKVTAAKVAVGVVVAGGAAAGGTLTIAPPPDPETRPPGATAMRDGPAARAAPATSGAQRPAWAGVPRAGSESAPGRSRAESAPGRSRTESAPGRSRADPPAAGGPSVEFVGVTPTKSTLGARRGRRESAPGRSRAVSAPGRSRAANAPGRSRAVSAPGRSRAANAPGRSREEGAPGRSRAESAPGRSRAVSAPGRSPGTSAPGGAGPSVDPSTGPPPRPQGAGPAVGRDGAAAGGQASGAGPRG